MNQIIQMTVMQSLTEVSQQVEEMTLANVMNYASSLVGKEVTLGVYDEKGNVKEVYGIVEASGTYDGAISSAASWLWASCLRPRSLRILISQ